MKDSGDLSSRVGFRGCQLLDVRGSLELLTSSHLRGGYQALLSGILAGGVWSGFLLRHTRGEVVPCRFCAGADWDGHFFLGRGECAHSLLVNTRENREYHGLMIVDEGAWPRCIGFPRARTIEDVASHRLDAALGAYSDGTCREWRVSGLFLSELADSRMSDDPDAWTDGSYVADDLSDICAGGCGVYAHRSIHCLRGGGRHLKLLPADCGLSIERCTLFDSVPGPLQSVQRAEMWCVICTLQSSSAVHLGSRQPECSSTCFWCSDWSSLS